jgi:hypothetical protein
LTFTTPTTTTNSGSKRGGCALSITPSTANFAARRELENGLLISVLLCALLTLRRRSQA